MSYERPKLNQTRYVGKDFDTYFDDMVQRAKSEFGSTWNNFAGSDPGVFFMDLMAYGLGVLSFYLDRQSSEVYLETAQIRENVAKIARQLGYKPGRATAATTDLTVSLEESYAFAVTLPEGFQFKTPAGLVFEAVGAVTWTAGDTSAKTVVVSQVLTKRAVFVSDGTANQVFDLPGLEDDQYLVGEALTVTVAGDVWEEEELLQLEMTDQYEVNYDSTPPRIRFGDGLTAGNLPGLGDEVRVSYKVTSGTLGNLSAGVLSTANGGTTSIPLIVAGNVIALAVVQSGKATGGSPPETLARIRVNAPRYYASRAVAVTRDDYQALSEAFSDPQYGRPAMVSAVNVRSDSEDTELHALVHDGEQVYEETLDAVDAQAADTEMGKRIDSVGVEAARVSGYSTDASDASTAAGTSASLVAGSAALISGYQSDMEIGLNEIDALADDIVDEVPSAAVIGMANQIKSKVTSLLGTVTSTNAAASGLATSKSNMETIQADLAQIGTNLGTSSTDLYSLETDLETYRQAILTATSDGRGGLSVATHLILDHVNSLWSSACQANIVMVPILTEDADGFYTAPPSGLIRRLEEYLNGIKDVTHSVKVIDGSSALVLATVSVLVKVQTNYVVSAVLAQVEEAVLEILRGRDYGDPLYLQTMYDLKDEIEGIEYLNVTLGPSDKLDSAGNLIPAEGEVITLGTVTVTEV